MSWHPTSRDNFEYLLREELKRLTPAALKIWQKYAIAPYEQSCVRNPDAGIGRIFVVARNGTCLLFFDDVEDEFGVGVPDSDSILRDLGTFGPLVAAVLALGKIESAQ